MKKIILLIALAATNLPLFAQKEVGIAEGKITYSSKVEGKPLEGPFKNDPHFYIKGVEHRDGKIYFYNRLTRPGMLSNDRKSVLGVSVVSGYTLTPCLGIVSISTDLKESETTVNNIHLFDTWSVESPYTYSLTTNRGGKLGSSETDMRLEELRQKYPIAFAEFGYQPETIVYNQMGQAGFSKNIAYTVVRSLKGFSLPDMMLQADDNKTSYTVDMKSLFDKVVLHGINVHNPQLDQWTSVVGEVLSGKENKRSEYRKLNFVTTDKSGKVIKNTEFDYGFTQEINFYQFLADEANPAGSKIVYLSRRRAFMKKYNDPDETRYDIVVLNSDGSLDFHHKFNFGEKSFELMNAYSYLHNGKVYVVGINGFGKGSLVLFEADKSGIKQIGAKASDVFGNAEQKINTNWIPYGSKVENGQLFVWGEQKVVVQTAMASDPATGKPRPEIINYINFSVMQIDLEGKKIVGQYTFDRKNPDLTKPTEIEEIILADNKLIIHVSETKRIKDASDIILNKLNFYTNSQYAKSGLDFLRLTRPVFYTVNYANKTADIFTVSAADYVNLYPKNSYFRDGNTIYFIGFKDDKTEGEMTYKVVKVSLD